MAETINDPIITLVNDHRTVEQLFRKFDASEGDERNEILQEIVSQLEMHAAVEEQAVYPALRELLPDGEAQVEHAIAEHAEVKKVLSRVDGADGNDPEIEAAVQALAQAVASHAKEEESTLLMDFREQVPPGKFTEIAEAADAVRSALKR